jgi:hypothetical protein
MPPRSGTPEFGIILSVWSGPPYMSGVERIKDRAYRPLAYNGD